VSNSSLRESIKLQSDILKLFVSSGEAGLSISQISKTLNKNRNSIKYELNQLEEAGFAFSGIKKLSLKRFPDSIQPPIVLNLKLSDPRMRPQKESPSQDHWKGQ
jgi:biotin operon repressor